MLNRGLDKLELLRIVEAVANEKSIDKELVIGSMESAIQKAALTKFGNDNNIEVIIDRETGEIKIILRGHHDLIHDISWSPNDNYLISSSADCSVKCYNLKNKEIDYSDKLNYTEND